MEIQLKSVRLAFADIFVPKAFDDSKEAKYGASFVFEKGSPAYKLLAQTQAAVAKEKWKEKADKVMVSLNATPDKVALRDGDTKAEYDGFEGNFYVKAGSAVRPTIIDRDRTPLTVQDGKPYSGCYVNAIIDVWAQDNTWGKRINATLKGIQFVKNGDSFGAATAPASADAFDDLGEGADADDLE